MGDEPGKRGPGWGREARGLTIGINLVLCIGIGTGLGYLVDQRLGLETPWGLIVGFSLGTAAGFRALFQATRE